MLTALLSASQVHGNSWECLGPHGYLLFIYITLIRYRFVVVVVVEVVVGSPCDTKRRSIQRYQSLHHLRCESQSCIIRDTSLLQDYPGLQRYRCNDFSIAGPSSPARLPAMFIAAHPAILIAAFPCDAIRRLCQRSMSVRTCLEQFLPAMTIAAQPAMEIAEAFTDTYRCRCCDENRSHAHLLTFLSHVYRGSSSAHQFLI